jgi:hypothetical protein
MVDDTVCQLRDEEIRYRGKTFNHLFNAGTGGAVPKIINNWSTTLVTASAREAQQPQCFKRRDWIHRNLR